LQKTIGKMENLTNGQAPAANSTLAIGGVSSPLDSFVVVESSVLRTNFCAEKPAHRQSAKRYMRFQKQSIPKAPC
jgi:hypothetical protein